MYPVHKCITLFHLYPPPLRPVQAPVQDPQQSKFPHVCLLQALDPHLDSLFRSGLSSSLWEVPTRIQYNRPPPSVFSIIAFVAPPATHTHFLLCLHRLSWARWDTVSCHSDSRQHVWCRRPAGRRRIPRRISRHFSRSPSTGSPPTLLRRNEERQREPRCQISSSS